MSSATLAEASPEVRALFDALLALMGEAWTNVNAYSSKDPNGATTCSVTATDPLTNSFTYTERLVGPRTTITPEAQSLGPGQTQQFTAAVVDSGGNPIAGSTVAWTTGAGALGSVDASGLYRAPATITAPNTETVTATDTAGGSSATATITLHP